MKLLTILVKIKGKTNLNLLSTKSDLKFHYHMHLHFPDPSYQHYYSIPKMTEPFQFIQVKNLGKNHGGDNSCYELLLNNFEIYGEIDEKES